MNGKALIAALVGGIILFVFGYIFYAVIFAGFFETNMEPGYMKAMTDINLGAVFIGNLCGGLILALIFGTWGNIKTLGAGAKAGGIFGLLVGLAVDLITFGTTNGPNFAAVIVDAILTGIMFAVAGAVVAMLLGRGVATEP